MALLANSYGDTSEIAAYCSNWVNASGLFDTTTTPTLLQVESWADQVSSALNSILREHGFVTPVTNADVKLMLDLFVNEEVAMIVEGVHGIGRFGPEARGRSSGAKSRNQLILEDARVFISDNQAGMGLMGATRNITTSGGIGYRGTDQSGDEATPLFQREQFGESYQDADE